MSYQSYKPHAGDRVIFNGYTIEQVKWGGCDLPYMLHIGNTYIVSHVMRHSQHTKVTLVGVVGQFNSVHFTRI